MHNHESYRYYIFLKCCNGSLQSRRLIKHKCRVDLIPESYPTETVTEEKNTIYLFSKIVVL